MTSTFREYLDGDVVGMANPFADRSYSGDHQWIDGNDNKLKLIFKLGSGVFVEQIDGSLYIKIKSGFKVYLTLTSSDMWAFTSITNSFVEQGYKVNSGIPQNDRITQWNTGLGGDSVMMIGLLGGDYLSISDSGGITLNLTRFDKENPKRSDTGDLTLPDMGWRTTDNLSSTADIVVQMTGVIRYTEVTGDWEGSGDEESDEVEENPDDELGIDDTPIDDSYHPMTDKTLGTNPFQDQFNNPMMGALYSVLVVAVLGSLWGRGG